MPYDVNYDSGLAERLNKMQMSSTAVAALTAIEGTETDFTKKRFAHLVYSISDISVSTGTGTAATSGLTSTGISTVGNVYHTCQINCASVDVPIAYQFEGSLDGTNWFNLGTSPSYITVSGTYGNTFTGKILQTRVNYLSGSGSLDWLYMGGH